MAGGWETARKVTRPAILTSNPSTGLLEVPGKDWVVLKLGHLGVIHQVEVDTYHFKGNFPESCIIYGTRYFGDLCHDDKSSKETGIKWEVVLPRAKLIAHKQHYFSFVDGNVNLIPNGVNFVNCSDGGGELHTEMETKLAMSSHSPLHVEWRDVTESSTRGEVTIPRGQLMRAAVKELKIGQLMHEDDFKLFDSMSALELMDPKMDCGMLVNGAPPPSIRARLEKGCVQLEFASARDVLATLDKLFCCEVAWLTGSPLAQSLLTSVYLHRDPLAALFAQLVTPVDCILASDCDVREILTTHVGNSAKDSLLLVMCTMFLATFQTANIIRDAVLRADIYEEEDFSPGNGMDIGSLALVSVEALDTMLQVTQERFEVLLMQHKAASSKKAAKKKHKKISGSGPGYEFLDSNARAGALICEAFIRRIRLRRELLATYAGLGLAGGVLDLQRAREGFHRAFELVERMATERLELDPECYGGKPIGFDPSISRLLLSGSPPRDVNIPPIDETLEQMKKVLKEMLIGCSPAEWQGMEDLRIFLVEFSRQEPTIVARSYVLVSVLRVRRRLFLYADSKIYARYNFMDWLSAAMVLNGVPTVLLSTQEGVLYSTRCIETVYESLKVFLHNRSRQRTRIEYLLEEWSVLQAEATAVDDKFTTEMNIQKAAYPRYFTAWSLEESVLLMIQYVVLGLELELYAPSEFGTVYWCVCARDLLLSSLYANKWLVVGCRYLDYLEGSRLQNLNITWTFVEKMKEIMLPHQPRGSSLSMEQPEDKEVVMLSLPCAPTKSSKKSKMKHKKHHHSAGATVTHSSSADCKPVDRARARFLREIKYTELQRSLVRAYFQLFHALERDGLVKGNAPRYSTCTIRFEHRFAPFQKLHYPAALTYDDFDENNDFRSYEPALIYKSAEECFKTARAHAEALLTSDQGVTTMRTTPGDDGRLVRGMELQALRQVSIANCLWLAQRSQHAGAKTKTPAPALAPSIQLDFSIHPHFPVVVLATSSAIETPRQ
ncbi:hypothetical protein PsorP6_009327 [Peronosclerospora sorghi]|uniref:Uncharacterized protein n=1 Tax=Peronosclerospora sorghi TaxID=230839 RepID=A0ACC0VZ10_9STRA|nr:hypothetical protein PsorP6_009327 [Peronosclerospora sorghi]